MEDLGTINENGCLDLVGCLNNVIIPPGFRVYPPEVVARFESPLAILEMAAVGLTDESLVGASSTCIVSVEDVIAIGHETLDLFCEVLAEKKTSDLVCLFDDLPHTDSAKVLWVEFSHCV